MNKKNCGVSDPDTRMQDMLAKLKSRDFRITPQRYAVVSILAKSAGHPSVDEVYQQVRTQFPTTSIATVYKTVTLLKELGEVLELGFHDGSNRYDGSRPYAHPHVICTHCSKIMDPELTQLDDLSREMARKTGYTIDSHRLDFFGVCPECQKKA